MTDDATACGRHLRQDEDALRHPQPECTDAASSQDGPSDARKGTASVRTGPSVANDTSRIVSRPKKALHDDFALAPPPPPDHARWPIWRAMSEADWQAQVIRMANQLGYRCYHAWLSVRSNPGYPDVHAVRPDREVYLECKTETGSLSANQRQWLALLLQAGHRAYVVRPSDEDALEDLLT